MNKIIVGIKGITLKLTPKLFGIRKPNPAFKSSFLVHTKIGVPTPVMELRGISKTFLSGKQELNILKGANFSINKGEIVALLGPSGAGKSTLLNIAGLLEHPDSGSIFLGGHNVSGLPDKARTNMRKKYIGFVYQSHHLLPEFSALENVVIPQMIAGENKQKAKARAAWLLDVMGLKERILHRPAELSGGEGQRVAIARALANCPHLLLADEPTGNLDTQTAEVVFDLLLNIIRQTGLSALIATHNPDLAAKMDRRVTLRDGKIIPLDEAF